MFATQEKRCDEGWIIVDHAADRRYISLLMMEQIRILSLKK
jgi:hypothetical protein